MRFNPYDDVKILGGCSIDPQSDSTSAVAVNGNNVDTLGGESAVLYARSAAASGTPTTFTIAFKVQESADGSTNFTDALDNTGTAIGFTLNVKTAAAENIARIEGLGSLNRKRYLRAVATPTITGGSSPAAVFFAAIIMGNGQQLPVTTTASNT